MIFPGPPKKPAMQYFCVEWSKAKFKTILKLIELIELGGLMHKDMAQFLAKMFPKIIQSVTEVQKQYGLSIFQLGFLPTSVYL